MKQPPCAYNRIAALATIALMLHVFAFVSGRGYDTATAEAATESVQRGDSGPLVTEVQTILSGFSYTVAVDGKFGNQTERAVRSWQRSNGLTIDGIVGNETLTSLRSARRIGNQMQVTPTATPTGLKGLPFAPEGLSACAEATFYRQQAGLPDAFDALIWRESNCKNTVTSRTGCCVGYLQLHYINWRDHRTIDGLAACDATWQNVKGGTPDAKQRQMCAAKVLFDVVGMQPWRL